MLAYRSDTCYTGRGVGPWSSAWQLLECKAAVLSAQDDVTAAAALASAEAGTHDSVSAVCRICTSQFSVICGDTGKGAGALVECTSAGRG